MLLAPTLPSSLLQLGFDQSLKGLIKRLKMLSILSIFKSLMRPLRLTSKSSSDAGTPPKTPLPSV